MPGRWKFTQGFATLTAVAFSALYTALFVTIFLQQDSTFQFQDFFTLDGVKRALSTDAVVLPAWVHYVAFDLFTAKWMVRHPALHASMLSSCRRPGIACCW
jgi:hypothetical protein